MTTDRSTAAFLTLLDDLLTLQTKGFIGPLPYFECSSSIKKNTQRPRYVLPYLIPQRNVKNKHFVLTRYTALLSKCGYDYESEEYRDEGDELRGSARGANN
jgi:hypothetical protein